MRIALQYESDCRIIVLQFQGTGVRERDYRPCGRSTVEWPGTPASCQDLRLHRIKRLCLLTRGAIARALYNLPSRSRSTSATRTADNDFRVIAEGKKTVKDENASLTLLGFPALEILFIDSYPGFSCSMGVILFFLQFITIIIMDTRTPKLQRKCHKISVLS